MVITPTVCCGPPLTLRLVSLELSPHLPSLLPLLFFSLPFHGSQHHPHMGGTRTHLSVPNLSTASVSVSTSLLQIHKSSYKASIPYHIQNLLFNPNLLCSYVFPSWPAEALTYTQSPGPQIQSHSAFLSLP